MAQKLYQIYLILSQKNKTFHQINLEYLQSVADHKIVVEKRLMAGRNEGWMGSHLPLYDWKPSRDVSIKNGSVIHWIEMSITTAVKVFLLERFNNSQPFLDESSSKWYHYWLKCGFWGFPGQVRALSDLVSGRCFSLTSLKDEI